MELGWKKMAGKYENGENLFLGRVHVGSAFYRGARTKGDPMAYGFGILLPGMKDAPQTSFLTLDEAKGSAEARVGLWLSRAGLASVQK